MSRSIVFFALCFWTWLVQVGASQGPTTVTLALEAARQHLERGECRLAIEQSQQAQKLIAASPRRILMQQAAAWEVLADSLEASGQFGQAQEAARQHLAAVQLLPVTSRGNASDKQESLQRLARLAAVVGNSDAARAYLQKALAIKGGLREDPLWEPTVILHVAKLDPANSGSSTAALRLREAAQGIGKLLDEYRFKRPAIERLEATFDLAKQLHLAQRNGDAARTAAAELEKWLPELSDQPTSRVNLLVQLADCYQAAGQPADEAGRLSQAIEILRGQQRNETRELQIATHLARLSKLPQDDDGSGNARRIEAIAILHRLAEPTAAVADPQAPAEIARTRQLHMECWDLLQQLYQAAVGEESDTSRATLLWSQAAGALLRLRELQQQLFVPEDPRIFRTQALLGGCQLRAAQLAAAELSLAESLKSGEQYSAAWQAGGGSAASVELELAAVRTNLAQAYKDGANYHSALDQLKLAQSEYQQFAEGSFLRAQCLVNLASAEAAFGDFSSALNHFKMADDIAGGLTPATAEVKDLRAVSLLNQAMLHKAQNQLAEALAQCRQAVDLRTEAQGPRAKAMIPYYVARSSLGVALFQQREAENKSAGATLDQALDDAKLAKELLAEHGQQESRLAADVYLALALAQHCLKETQEAKKNWEKARKLAHRDGRVAIEVRALNYLVELAMQEAKRWLDSFTFPRPTPERTAEALHEAKEWSAQALELQTKLQAYPTVHYSVLRNRAQILHALGEQKEAIKLLHQAVASLEVPRTLTTGGDLARAAYFGPYQKAYDLLAEWHCQAKPPEVGDAVIACELGLNRTFLDQVRLAGVDWRTGLDPRLLDEYNRLVFEYQQTCNLLHSADSATEAAPAGDTLRRQIDGLQRQIHLQEEKLRDASPRYRELCVAPTSELTKQALDELVTNDNLLVYYHVGQQRCRLFVGTRSPGQTEPQYQELELHATPEKQPSDDGQSPFVARLDRLIHNALAALSESDETQNPKRSGALQELSRILLPAELQQQIHERPPAAITIIADGPLQLLPFEALLAGSPGDYKYALEVFPPLQYVPSANIAHAIAQRQVPPSAAFVTVAPKYYGDEISLWRGESLKLSDLPEALEESKSVFSELNRLELHGKSLREEQAVQDSVLAALPGNRFIHLAGHGIVREEHGNWFGGIPLTQRAKAKELQMLTLGQIINLNLTACDLAALSVCRSNRAAEQTLDASSSLSGAFLAAGARRVLSSHWMADDVATKDLMTDFFTRIGDRHDSRQPVNYAHALREAKQDLIRAGKRPYHWAPFVLIGLPQERAAAPAAAEKQLSQTLPGLTVTGERSTVDAKP